MTQFFGRSTGLRDRSTGLLDDFEDTDFSEWVEHVGTMSRDNTYASTGSYSALLSQSGGDTFVLTRNEYSMDFRRGDTMKFDYQYDDNNQNGYDRFYFGVQVDDAANATHPPQSCYAVTWNFSDQAVKIHRRDNGSWTQLGSTSHTMGSTTNWENVFVRWKSHGEIQVGEEGYFTLTVNDNTYDEGAWGFSQADGGSGNDIKTWYDNVRITKITEGHTNN